MRKTEYMLRSVHDDDPVTCQRGWFNWAQFP
jgi:meiotically up-regulated gene 157 (Mug157) protein